MAQLIELDSQYPGGLLQYAANAVDLLAASAAGENPLEGFKPSVPEGVPLEFSTEGFGAAEETGAGPAAPRAAALAGWRARAWRRSRDRSAGLTGIRAVASTAFVLVAGGLGERLGYGGIKVALPSEITTGKCYLALYIECAPGPRVRTPAGRVSAMVVSGCDCAEAVTWRGGQVHARAANAGVRGDGRQVGHAAPRHHDFRRHAQRDSGAAGGEWLFRNGAGTGHADEAEQGPSGPQQRRRLRPRPGRRLLRPYQAPRPR